MNPVEAQVVLAAGDGASSPHAPTARPADETIRSVRNAFMLSASLLATWAVALLARLLLPRSLGPALFGEFNVADALAANAFVFVGFGLDTYIQKEAPGRPQHISEFLGGVLVVRALGSLLLFAGLAAFLTRGGSPPAVVRTVMIFGLAQVASICSSTLATLLYVSQTVGRLALLNVASKVVWGLGVGLVLLLNPRMEWFALAFLISEALRLVALFRLVAPSLKLRIDLRTTWAVLLASTPFYLASVSGTLYAKIDVSIMGALIPAREVGFYSSAANVAGMAMLMAPLMGWVLMPQLARAASRSRDELNAMFRRSIEWVLAVAVPVSMMLALGADVIVLHVFGPRFLPAIDSLRALSPIFVAVYLAMLASTYLNLTDRSWSVTLLTIGSFVLNAGLNLIFVRLAFRRLGEGGAGVGAAIISVGSEILVAAVLLVMIGRSAWDRRSVLCAVKSLAACAVVCGAHVAMRSLGPARLVLDLALYLALIVATGAVHVRELYSVLRSASRGSHAAA